MPSIEITTNIGCKVVCKYCPQARIIAAYAKRSDILQMSLDTFKACIDKIPINVVIYFSGMSEAWLNPGCTRMVLYAHQRGHKIGVFTTLVGMAPGDIDLIEHIPFIVFCVHLPSDSAAGRYENINVNENYLKVLAKIARSRIRASYTVFDGNPRQEVKELLEKERIVCLKLGSRARNIGIESRAMPEKRRGEIGCALNLRGNMLLPNGDVILCCMDYNMQHILGNLLTSDYKTLFKGAEFLNIEKGLREESLNILCRYCEEYTFNPNILNRFYIPLVYYLKNFTGMRIMYRFFSKYSSHFGL